MQASLHAVAIASIASGSKVFSSVELIYVGIILVPLCLAFLSTARPQPRCELYPGDIEFPPLQKLRRAAVHRADPNGAHVVGCRTLLARRAAACWVTDEQSNPRAPDEGRHSGPALYVEALVMTTSSLGSVSADCLALAMKQSYPRPRQPIIDVVPTWKSTIE